MFTRALVAVTLAALPVSAFAQGATQSPPSPNAASSAPTPATSTPSGALTMNPGTAANPNVSGPVGATSTMGGAPTTMPAPAAGAGGGMANTVPTPAK